MKHDYKLLLETLVSLHKRVDVNRLSDEEWRKYQAERRLLENKLRKV